MEDPGRADAAGPAARSEQTPDPTRRRSRAGHVLFSMLILASGIALVVIAAPSFSGRGTFGPRVTSHPAGGSDLEDVQEVLDQYCMRCHNERRSEGEFALDVLDVANPSTAAEAWEKVVRKLRTGTMPPQKPSINSK